MSLSSRKKVFLEAVGRRFAALKEEGLGTELILEAMLLKSLEGADDLKSRMGDFPPTAILGRLLMSVCCCC